MNFREFYASMREHRTANDPGDIQDGKPPAPTRTILDRVVCHPDDMHVVQKILFEINPWEGFVESSPTVPPLHVEVVYLTKGRDKKSARYQL